MSKKLKTLGIFFIFTLILLLNTKNITASEEDLVNWLCTDESYSYRLVLGDDFEIKNAGHGGYDDLTWRSLDKIKIFAEIKNEEVETDNPENNILKNFVVEIAIFSPYKDGENIIDDMRFINEGGERIELGDLEYNEEKGGLFEFNVPLDMEPTPSDHRPNDTLWNGGFYVIAMKAHGQNIEGKEECIHYIADIEVKHNSYGDRIFQLEQKISELEDKNTELENKTSILEERTNSLQATVEKIMKFIEDLPRRFTK